MGCPSSSSLVHTDYHLNMILGQSALSKQQEPTALFEFTIKAGDGDSAAVAAGAAGAAGAWCSTPERGSKSSTTGADCGDGASGSTIGSATFSDTAVSPSDAGAAVFALSFAPIFVLVLALPAVGTGLGFADDAALAVLRLIPRGG